MTRMTLALILTALMFILAVTAEVPAGGPRAASEPEAAALVIEPAPQGPGQIPHAGIVIHLVNPEQSLWLYKQVYETKVIPQFLTELKEQDADVANEMAERIIVHIHQPTNTIWVYVRDGCQNPKWADYAMKLGEMGVRRFNALDQAKRVQLMAQLTKDKSDLEAKLRKSEQKLRGLERYVADAKAESSLLWQQLSSMKSELTQGQLKKAELETKLKFLARKAEEVKDTVSSEQIAALEKAAQQIEMQVEEQGSEDTDTIKRYQMILMQKQRELERVMDLHKKAFISQAEVEKAQFDLEMAKNDYEGARRKMGDLRQRLERVRADLERAKENFAQTGGLALATVIAEKTLECESELASVEGKIPSLARKIEETEKRIDEYRSLDRELEEEKARNDQVGKQLAGLVQKEKQLDRRIRVGAKISRSPKDCYRVGGYSDIGEEQPGTYEVVGEVKKPGSFKALPRTTLMEAMVAAGWFTDNADAHNIIVLRAAKEGAPEASGGESRAVRSYVLDFMPILKGKADDFTIEPDDTVIVPSKESAS